MVGAVKSQEAERMKKLIFRASYGKAYVLFYDI